MVEADRSSMRIFSSRRSVGRTDKRIAGPNYCNGEVIAGI